HHRRCRDRRRQPVRRQGQGDLDDLRGSVPVGHRQESPAPRPLPILGACHQGQRDPRRRGRRRRPPSPPYPAMSAAMTSSAGAAPLLEIRALRKSFSSVEVLHGVGFTLVPGQVLGLVGENGSGKSTTMNILGGVLQSDGGSMLLDGQPYAPEGPRVARDKGIG